MSIFNELRRTMGGGGDVPIGKLKELLDERYQEELAKVGKFNILVLGKTGVGKSTLVNAVFGEAVAATGTGAPVTQHLQRYEKHGLPLVMYDAKGIELNAQTLSRLKEEIDTLLQKYRQTGKEEDCIHFVWYCINTQGRRIEAFEKDLVAELATKHNIPVILVLTQFYGEARELRRQLPPNLCQATACVGVVAKPIIIDASANFIVHTTGLEELLYATCKVLPDARRNAFIKAQKVSIDLKRERARKTVNALIATNAGVGFVPIPFADAPILIGFQVLMISRVSAIFSSSYEQISKSLIPYLVSVGGIAGATIVGKMLVGNLLKLIPGAGWILGGSISATTAALLTGTLGYAYIEVMCKIEEEKGQTGRDFTDAEFAQRLKDAYMDAAKNKKSTLDY